MRGFFLDFARTTGLYAALLLGGTVLIMVATAFVGYLPYSDRPGPGWYGWRGSISLQEFSFVLQWSIFLVVPAVIVGAFLFSSAQLLQWMRAPRWLTATLGAVVAGVLSLMIVASVGWIIALGGVPVYGAGVIGGLFGGWLLPRYGARPTTSVSRGMLYRLSVLGLWCVSTGLVLHPFVSWPWSDPGFALEVRLIQLTRGPETLTGVDGLTAEELADLTSTGTKGRLTANVSFSGCSGAGCRGAERGRLIVVIERPVDKEVVLPEPAVGARVIYVQEGTQWKKLPPQGPVSKRTLKLRPADGARERFMFQVQGEEWQTAYWLGTANE